MRLIDLSSSETSLKLAINHAAEAIGEGEIIIAPTETAYGFLADAKNSRAMSELFRLKRRTFDKPSAIFVRSSKELKQYGVRLSMSQLTAINQFWPGPVTFVIRSEIREWPGILSADGKIGFRCSEHRLIREITGISKKALTATSANISGKPAKSLEELKAAFSDKVELFIVDPELDFNSLPSTVVELMDGSVKILREGRVPWAVIKKGFADE